MGGPSLTTPQDLLVQPTAEAQPGSRVACLVPSMPLIQVTMMRLAHCPASCDSLFFLFCYAVEHLFYFFVVYLYYFPVF